MNGRFPRKLCQWRRRLSPIWSQAARRDGRLRLRRSGAERLTYGTVLAFARDRVAPGAAERDRTSQFDYGLYRELGALGVPGMLYPESVGGTNASTLAFCLALEAISRVDMSLGWVLWVGAGGARSLMRGSEEQVAARRRTA